MPLKLALIVVALLLVGGAAWLWLGRGPDRPHVVLVSIDSLRADHVGCYGYARDTTPFLDRLAKEGVVFDTVVSSSSWTTPAHAALFTGLPDRVHGCFDETRWLDGSRETVAEAFKRAGYRTVGFFSGPPLHPNFGFAQGFDTYHDCTTYSKESLAFLRGEATHEAIGNKPNTVVTNPEVLGAVRQWLEQARDDPFFMFIHLWDVHYDYVPPEPYDRLFDPDYRGPCTGRDVLRVDRRPGDWSDRDVEHLKALYDGEIRWTDDTLRKIIDAVSRRFGTENTVIVVTSDHGEAFYEHGVHGHRMTLYGEEIRIPLIIRYPPSVPRNARVSAMVSLLDVAPTLLELAGVKGLPDATGRSRVPLMRGASPPEPVEPAICELIDNKKKLHLFALRFPEWKAILDLETSSSRVFDLRRDPGEQHPLGEADYPVAAAEIPRLYRRTCTRLLELSRRLTVPTERDTPPISAFTEAQLRALGYLK